MKCKGRLEEKQNRGYGVLYTSCAGLNRFPSICEFDSNSNRTASAYHNEEEYATTSACSMPIEQAKKITKYCEQMLPCMHYHCQVCWDLFFLFFLESKITARLETIQTQCSLSFSCCCHQHTPEQRKLVAVVLCL